MQLRKGRKLGRTAIRVHKSGQVAGVVCWKAEGLEVSSEAGDLGGKWEAVPNGKHGVWGVEVKTPRRLILEDLGSDTAGSLDGRSRHEEHGEELQLQKPRSVRAFNPEAT